MVRFASRTIIACHAPDVRIGTWNLAGRWTPRHESFLLDLDCDVLLLTEVNERLVLPGYAAHMSTALMAEGRRWAAVLSRTELAGLPDPHPASAMAHVNGMTFCSSILPWRACGSNDPWIPGPHSAKTEHALQSLLGELQTSGLVWGGDWNHALRETEYAGSKAGRRHLLDALSKLNLQTPTTDLPHQIDGLLSIDHVAIPMDATVSSAQRVSALLQRGRLSDHDAYVVELGACRPSVTTPH